MDILKLYTQQLSGEVKVNEPVVAVTSGRRAVLHRAGIIRWLSPACPQRGSCS